ncbi:hypothetical protein FH972_010900 [Carpinus fangiana]|uniref:Uncharacterized protein n=1 Tax=Carpinus fangiana TaxID=176857 RepID=A0A660KRI5_9ROSI|nr:hypothetical protein FH972_010900 [Carpinus fangiana]
MPSIIESKPMHPLHQIAETPTHKLLLKQWLKEEELILGRIIPKETQIDSARKEITMLYIFWRGIKRTERSWLRGRHASKAKSLRVEAKAVRKWSVRDFATLYFFTVSCLVLGITRVIDCLCGGGHDNQKEEAGREEEERDGQKREK